MTTVEKPIVSADLAATQIKAPAETSAAAALKLNIMILGQNFPYLNSFKRKMVDKRFLEKNTGFPLTQKQGFFGRTVEILPNLPLNVHAVIAVFSEFKQFDKPIINVMNMYKDHMIKIMVVPPKTGPYTNME